MSFTFLAKSSAYSWKMSFDGQVDCQRMLIGPAWPLAIIGNPRVAAPAVAAAAPARNLRREAVSVFLDWSLLIRSSIGMAVGVAVSVLFFLAPRKRLPGPYCSGLFRRQPSRCHDAKA